VAPLVAAALPPLVPTAPVFPSLFSLFFLLFRRRPMSTLFPYTTLFRSIFLPGPELQYYVDRRRQAGASHRERAMNLTLIAAIVRSEEHTSELQSRRDLVCRLLLDKKKNTDE